jgi:hypothetical protein
MIKLFDRNSTKLTISEFYDNFERGKYNFDVDYQRRSNVWNDDKKSFLIDSIMKNYPMPPIFIRPSIDNQTGKTKYDIVDGKQRLETIIGFIENRVPLTDYFSEDGIFDGGASDVELSIGGKLFSDIKLNQEYNDFVKQFWTYSLNIDYLYQDDIALIANVFDRLNRNGEPLNRQELRNAKYSQSCVLAAVKELSASEFWNARFERLKLERMEDEEFISELFFIVAENQILESSPNILDDLYDKYAIKNETEIGTTKALFNLITQFILDLNIDFIQLKKLSWTTHLYGLFSFAWYCMQKSHQATEVRDVLISLYSEYFGKKSRDYSSLLFDYKVSCSSRTRSRDQREKRLNAIKQYCNIT